MPGILPAGAATAVRRALILGALAIAPGCYRPDALAVCDRPGPAEGVANRTFVDGRQRVASGRALSPLPGQGAFAAFLSDVSGFPSGEQQVVRGVVLDSKGGPQRTCNEPGELTYTPVGATARVHYVPAVVQAARADGIGLLAYVVQEGARSWVEGQMITASGCAVGTTSPFTISEELTRACPDKLPRDATPYACITGLSVVRLSALSAGPDPLGGTDDFVVVWTTMSGDLFGQTLEAHARILRARAPTPLFLATEPGKNDLAVRLSPRGQRVFTATAVAVANRRFFLLWQDGTFEKEVRLRTQAQLFDDRFVALRPPVELSVSRLETPDRFELEAAFDGRHVLAAWIERDGAGTGRDAGTDGPADAGSPAGSDPSAPEPRVFMSLLRPDGEVLPDRARVRLTRSTSGREDAVAVTASPGRGGFVVAWQEQDVVDRARALGRDLRLVRLDPEGRPAFANPACGATDFSLLPSPLVDRGRMAITQLDDGGIAVVWTDAGGAGDLDRSLSAIRTSFFTPKSFFPVR